MRREKLSELLDISIGRTPSRNEPEYWGKGHRWVSIRDLSSKTVTETKEQITDRAVTEARCKIVRKGTLLFSFKLTIGKMAFAGCDLFTNEAIAAFSIKNETTLNSEFLYFALQSATYGGSNQAVMGKTLNSKSLAEIEIPLPPLGDQIRIAHLLGKVEGLIAQRKQHLQQLDDLLKSVFLEMFGDPVRNEKGWEIKEITDVCDEIVDCVNKTAPQVEEPTPFVMVRTSNIRGGKISLEKIKFVDAETYKIWTRRSKPRFGDILFTREAPMGEAGMIDFDDQIFLGQRIMQYRCNLKIANPKFILELMKTRFFQRQVEKLGKGSTVKHLAVPDCFKFKVIAPPVPVQNQFASIVEKIEGIKSRYQQSLADLEALYGTLSQKAFKGELDLARVPLPADQVPQVDPAPPPKDFVAPTEVLNHLVQNAPPESRNELLTRWFNRYLANTSPDVSLDSREFFEAGWQTLQETRLESEGESPALTLADYDALKDLIFAALEDGTLVQTFAEESNRVSLHRRPSDWGSF